MTLLGHFIRKWKEEQDKKKNPEPEPPLFRSIYEEEIDQFFMKPNPDYSNLPKEKGNVWVAGMRRNFQALTVEPPQGGQYEIAVRFHMECDRDWARPGDIYSGYIAEKGYLVGRNTDGH